MFWPSHAVLPHVSYVVLVAVHCVACSSGPKSLEPISAPREPLVVIHVVDGDTGLPIEGALVRRIDAEQSSEHERSALPSTFDAVGLERAFRDRPVVARTDDHGNVRLPRPGGRAVVAVESGRLFASETLENDGPATIGLELLDDSPVRVLVRDARGDLAAGVPVALRHRARGGPWFDRLRVRTDSRGRATLPHARYAMSWNESWRSDDIEWSVGIASCLGVLVAKPLSREVVDDEIDLVLPPNGEVDVVLVDVDGASIDGEIEVGLAPRASALHRGDVEADPLQAFGSGGLGPRLTAPPGGEVELAHEGRARFRFVGLNCDLVAVAARNGAS